jgi:hypothetical protein
MISIRSLIQALSEGSRFVVQNILYVVDDQSLPRYDLRSVSFVLTLTKILLRRCHHDNVPCFVRERVLAYRLHLLYGPRFKRTHHGRSRNHHMVRAMFRLDDSPSHAFLVGIRHLYMVVSEVVTLLFYAISIVFLPEYFGAFFIHVRDITCSSWCYRSLVCGFHPIRMEGRCNSGG